MYYTNRPARSWSECPQIYKSNYSLNINELDYLSDWFSSKTASNLILLSEAVEHIKSERALSKLRLAVFQSIAIFAMVKGFELELDTFEATELIMKEGFLGFEKFIKKYEVDIEY